MADVPFLGHGVGLRVRHYARALECGLDVDWIEAISENFFGDGGRPRAVLERLRRDLPVVFHGVSLAIGSSEPPDSRYLESLARLFARYEPAWVSDHLCWGRNEGRHAHELLPLPYTEEALRCVCEHVDRVQTYLRRPIALENVSSYVEYTSSQMPEWEFLNAVAARTGCGILLDLNNIIVSASNHGYQPCDYLQGIDGERVWQFHLANHSDRRTHRFDDHCGPVPVAVWQLFEDALKAWGVISSLVEWDEDVPEWELLRDQQREATRRACVVADSAEMPPPCTDRVRSSSAYNTVPGGTLAGERFAGRRSEAPEPQQRFSLAHTQSLFWDLMTHPSGVEPFCEGVPPSKREQVETTFSETPAFARVDRLDVYANSYFWRLHGVILTQFPVLAWLLGEVDFHNLLVDFVLEHPSRDPNISKFGTRLPGYLDGHHLARQQPWLPQVAAVECALYELIDVADSRTVAGDAVAQLPVDAWPFARFVAIPAARLIDCAYSFAALTRLHRLAVDPPDRVAATPEEHVLVWRQGFSVRYRHLHASEARAVAGLLANETFSQICGLAGEVENDLCPETVIGWLRGWLDGGLIQAIERS